MAQIISASQAVQFFKSGQTLMIGGFLTCGSPQIVIDELLKTNLAGWTLIANDTSTPESDRGKLIAAHKIKKAIVSHIGTNPQTVEQMNSGKLEVDLVPQGTLAERVRAGGAGLGGILTPVGLNTDVAKNKQLINVDGQDFLLEKPLKADVALVYATYADKYGNLAFYGSTRNFNAIMPLAAQTVIAEVDELSETALNPNHVVVPGIFVDYVVVRGKNELK
ncbi:MAG: CoA transferase subunit A [Alphaproteobacteria bacterium]|nr:CoA transferase subunit A [Alphaproteobacteria bacterium]